MYIHIIYIIHIHIFICTNYMPKYDEKCNDFLATRLENGVHLTHR